MMRRSRVLPLAAASMVLAFLVPLPWRLSYAVIGALFVAPVSPWGGMWIPGLLDLRPGSTWYIVDWTVFVGVAAAAAMASRLLGERVRPASCTAVAALALWAASSVVALLLVTDTASMLWFPIGSELVALVAAVVSFAAMLSLALTDRRRVQW